MVKKLTIFALLFFLLQFFQTQPGADAVVKSQGAETEIVSKKLDKHAQILHEYLASFNSPLQYSAQDFIDAANIYGLDWKMLPAIAGVESTFGKEIPGGFNAWGWGVYGTQAIYFNSWRDGIFTIAKGLRENYINKGLTEPYAINRIYAASPFWGGHVTYFMQDLEKFASKYESSKVVATQTITAPRIAAVSGQLILR